MTFQPGDRVHYHVPSSLTGAVAPKWHGQPGTIVKINPQAYVNTDTIEVDFDNAPGLFVSYQPPQDYLKTISGPPKSSWIMSLEPTDCFPPNACQLHGRCWAHSCWEEDPKDLCPTCKGEAWQYVAPWPGEPAGDTADCPTCEGTGLKP